jgi:hypothetical protein
METREVKVKLKESGVHPSTLSKRGGVFTARRSFFYTHGKTSEMFANDIKKALPNAEIIEHQEQWRAFRGGASVADQSHWWVKFKI